MSNFKNSLALSLITIIMCFNSIEVYAADYRSVIGSALLTNSNGTFDYEAFEDILNLKFGTDEEPGRLKAFISSVNGNCSDNGCNLWVESGFCSSKKALISFKTTMPKITVKAFTDGC